MKAISPPADPLEFAPMVMKLAKKKWSCSRGLDLFDIFEEGIVGLLIAYRRYEDGFRPDDFAAYVHTVVRMTIAESLRDYRWIHIDRKALAEYRHGKSTRRASQAGRACNECRKRLRHAAGHDRGFNRDFIDVWPDPVPPDDPDVWDMLSCLTPDESEVVQLKIGIDGFDARGANTVGEMMGIDRHRVAYLYRKAIKKLREHLHATQRQGR